MLESRDFLSNDRIYMPLSLEGPSYGGTLRIRADLLSSPTPPIVEPIVEPRPLTPEEEIISETTIIDLPGGGTTTVAETQPAVVIETPTTTVGTIPIVSRDILPTDITNVYGGWSFLKSFIAPPSTPNTTFNIWIGRAATLVYSGRHSSSFEIAVPVNFFQDVALVETSYETPPPTGGGGTPEIQEAAYGGWTFGNPLVLGDFGSDFMLTESESELPPVYPTITSEALAVSLPTLNAGYHPCFIEVITNGNTWRVHVEIEYDYERTGSAAEYEDPPIIRNIIVNKSYPGMARISWGTNVKCDRNWVVYGVGSITAPIDAHTVEADIGTLYPYASLTMQDGTWYYIQVFSELKGRITNSEPFSWKMPDENISKTVDLTIQANSSDGLIGDGTRVEDIESQQILTRGGSDIPIIPIIAIGGISLLGLGGAAWYLFQRKKS